MASRRLFELHWTAVRAMCPDPRIANATLEAVEGRTEDWAVEYDRRYGVDHIATAPNGLQTMIAARTQTGRLGEKYATITIRDSEVPRIAGGECRAQLHVQTYGNERHIVRVIIATYNEALRAHLAEVDDDDDRWMIVAEPGRPTCRMLRVHVGTLADLGALVCHNPRPIDLPPTQGGTNEARDGDQPASRPGHGDDPVERDDRAGMAGDPQAGSGGDRVQRRDGGQPTRLGGRPGECDGDASGAGASRDGARVERYVSGEGQGAAGGGSAAPAIPEKSDMARHYNDLWTLARLTTNTEMVPKALRGRPDAALAVMVYGNELGLRPMTSLREVFIIDGTPSCSAKLMRALILRAGHRLSWRTLSRERAVLYGQRRDKQSDATVDWSLDDAKAAGIAGKDVWKRYPRSMLAARATSELARLIFPDVTIGYTPEELGGATAHFGEYDSIDVEADDLPGYVDPDTGEIIDDDTPAHVIQADLFDAEDAQDAQWLEQARERAADDEATARAEEGVDDEDR